MTSQGIMLVVVTICLLVSIVTSQNDGRQGRRCPRRCADWQCNYHCKRVRYASGKCYQNPFVCNASKGRILCSCYRFYQPTSSGTTLPPVIVSAIVTEETTPAPENATTPIVANATVTPTTANGTYIAGTSSTLIYFSALPSLPAVSYVDSTATSQLISGTEIPELIYAYSVTPSLEVTATATDISSTEATSAPILPTSAVIDYVSTVTSSIISTD
ncbi:hypothetical protein BsWGS_21916 [Bradybaena similaris]